MEIESQFKLESDWENHLIGEFKKTYMNDLRGFLCSEITKRKTIYPKESEYFNAFNSTSFDKVKVVVLGQDPYHGTGQAHGLCFSVPHGVEIPPSLTNIFKEIKSDLCLNSEDFKHGNLISWANQGVLLLNSVLTVEKDQALSHQGKGWETFTDEVIDLLNKNKAHIVFMLWGAYAQRKGASIDRDRHLVLEASHPSPFSARLSFLGCRHFSKANTYLIKHGQDPVDWRIL